MQAGRLSSRTLTVHQAPSAKEDRIAVLRQIVALCAKVAHLSVGRLVMLCCLLGGAVMLAGLMHV